MTTRYFLYARKSQGRSDRQMLSIPAQISEMTAFAQKQEISIVQVFTEARTAKEPGRPVFNTLLDRIEKGEADGIITWKIDRLSRNPIDDGRISWMLQRGTVQKIQTIERTYHPEDNVLFMRMEQGMANQYIRDLSRNVARGLRDKAKRGWLPVSMLPLGYMRNPDKKNSKVIIQDPEKFKIVQELWKTYATGNYSVAEIKRLGDDLGLKNHRGNLITLPTFHLMFKNPFYCGHYFWKDIDGTRKRIEGKHKAMISEAEFLIVHDVLKNRGRKTRCHSRDFIYKTFMTCGECLGNMTAERKHQVICTKCKYKSSILTKQLCARCDLHIAEMDNPSIIDITYYRCTKRKNPKCSQRAITESAIEQCVMKTLSMLKISKEAYLWAKERLEGDVSLGEENKLRMNSLKSKRSLLKDKINRLVELRLSGELTRDENLSLKAKFTNELDHVSNEIIRRESEMALWKGEARRYIEFAKNCVERFKNGSKTEKKEIMSVFCSNLKIRDKTPYFSTKKPLEGILSVNPSPIREKVCSNAESTLFT